MKLVTHLFDEHEQLAIYHEGYVYNMDRLHPDMANTMGVFLNYWDDMIDAALKLNRAIVEGKISTAKGIAEEDVQLLAPVPFPTSCREGYAFRQHVEAATRNRGLPMIAEYDKFPVFYFTNHNAIQGPGNVYVMPDHLQKLDFELQFAIVISRAGRNITAAEADSYIGGLLIMNSLSTRKLQMEETVLSPGPARGKDFSTATGPWLVTPDELAEFEVPGQEGHTGTCWNLPMIARVNGVEVSRGNTAEMQWTFAEIIERCSYGVTLHAGDIIGSGAVGTGCFLELNGTRIFNDDDYREQWLQPGDDVEMEIEGLGILRNTITEEDSVWSLTTSNDL